MKGLVGCIQGVLTTAHMEPLFQGPFVSGSHVQLVRDRFQNVDQTDVYGVVSVGLVCWGHLHLEIHRRKSGLLLGLV